MPAQAEIDPRQERIVNLGWAITQETKLRIAVPESCNLSFFDVVANVVEAMDPDLQMDRQDAGKYLWNAWNTAFQQSSDQGVYIPTRIKRLADEWSRALPKENATFTLEEFGVFSLTPNGITGWIARFNAEGELFITKTVTPHEL